MSQVSTSPSSTTPAACSTPTTGWSAGTSARARARASWSATSTAATSASRTQFGQPLHQFHRTGGRRAAAGQQQQPGHTARTHQVLRDHTTQHTRTTGDHHGAVGQGGRLSRLVLGHRLRHRGHAYQAGDRHRPVPERELRLVGVDGPADGVGQLLVRLGAGLDVDQGEPVRVLGLDPSDQSPDGRGGQVGGLGVVGDGHRAGGDQDQSGIEEPGLGQPGAHQFQNTQDGGVARRGVLAGRRLYGGQHDGGHGLATVDGGDQRGRVGVPCQGGGRGPRAGAEQRPATVLVLRPEHVLRSGQRRPLDA